MGPNLSIRDELTTDRPIGREEELELLMHGLGQALDGRGNAFFISGPPGVGKSHLIFELDKAARHLDFSICRTTCVPEHNVFQRVFGVFVPTEKKTDQEGNNNPLVVFNNIQSRCAEAPLLLELEDLHWADNEVVATLIYISRNISKIPVMMVGSIQTEGSIDDSREVDHPFSDGLRIMRREGVCIEIELKNLDQTQLRKVLEVELHAELDDRLARALWEVSNGNPMVAKETARLLVQTRKVVNNGERWEVSGDLTLELSDDIYAMVRQRLDLLTAEDLRILELASMIGEYFDPTVIATIQKRPLLKVLEHIDVIRHEHGLIQETSDCFRFSQGATRVVLLDRISDSRKKEMHRQIGMALEGVASKEDFQTISDHYYQAEARSQCVCFALLAGQRSLEEEAWEDARSNFQKVLDATDMGGFEEERIYSIECMADAEFAMGDYDSANHRYEELLVGTLSDRLRERITRKKMKSPIDSR